MAFFGRWYDLPWQLRLGVALLLIAIAAIILVAAGRIWWWGWIIGSILLFISGKSDSEKNGYNF